MTEDLEKLFGKKIIGAGYDEGEDGYYLMFVFKSKEYYFYSKTPIELDVREIH